MVSDEDLRPSPATSLAGVRVLVVDDHEDTRDLIEQALVYAGASVIAAGSAREALPHVDRASLIVTDYAMPGVSGTELIRRARMIDPGRRAILITGYADVEMIINRPPDVSVLLKPFTLAQLQDTVLAAVGERAESRT